jgi:hypothetical protein
MNQVWSVATNGAVKGYFLDRAGDAYRKSNGAIIAFKSREAAQRKANSLNRWRPGDDLAEARSSWRRRSEAELRQAAREVLDRWETGDLAGAMRRLDAALSAYRNRKPRRI